MQINKNIAVSQTGFIFNPITGDSFSTNPIGREIIAMLNEGKDQNTIQEELLKRYTVDEATLEQDITDFLQVLLSYQFISDYE